MHNLKIIFFISNINKVIKLEGAKLKKDSSHFKINNSFYFRLTKVYRNNCMNGASNPIYIR